MKSSSSWLDGGSGDGDILAGGAAGRSGGAAWDVSGVDGGGGLVVGVTEGDVAGRAGGDAQGGRGGAKMGGGTSVGLDAAGGGVTGGGCVGGGVGIVTSWGRGVTCQLRGTASSARATR